MVERLVLLLAALVAEACHKELLHVVQAVWFALVLGEEVLDGYGLDFFLQQVGLVQEQDDGDVAEHAVVDNSAENVERLREPVGLTVLHQHLVELARRYQEQDGGDAVEALKPAAPLGALPANVHHLERDILDLKVVLVDAFGGSACQ